MKTPVRFVCDKCGSEFDPFVPPAESRLCGECAWPDPTLIVPTPPAGAKR